MEEALIAHLLAHAGLSSLVGQRVTWVVRDRGAGLPAVVLHRIDSDRSYVMGGPVSLVRARVQADCWAKTYASSKATARAVTDALSGFKDTVNGVQFQGVFSASERDLSEEGDAPAEMMFRQSLDFQIWHSE